MKNLITKKLIFAYMGEIDSHILGLKERIDTNKENSKQKNT